MVLCLLLTDEPVTYFALYYFACLPVNFRLIRDFEGIVDLLTRFVSNTFLLPYLFQRFQVPVPVFVVPHGVNGCFANDRDEILGAWRELVLVPFGRNSLLIRGIAILAWRYSPTLVLPRVEATDDRGLRYGRLVGDSWGTRAQT